MAQLAAKRERFVAEYLVDLNAAQAAIRAGYASANAKVTGHRLVHAPAVAARIRALQKARGDKLEVTQEFVLTELRRVAQQDDVAQGTKVRALELLGKHLGMFVERHEVKVGTLTPQERAARIEQLLRKGSGQ